MKGTTQSYGEALMGPRFSPFLAAGVNTAARALPYFSTVICPQPYEVTPLFQNTSTRDVVKPADFLAQSMPAFRNADLFAGILWFGNSSARPPQCRNKMRYERP